MGLFDTIFLDQNPTTAVLDAPPTDTETQVSSQTSSLEAVLPATVDRTPVVSVDEVSFDDVSVEQSQSEDEKPKGFLSGGDPTAPISDDISFDIGGIDMPGLDSVSTAVSENRGDSLKSDHSTSLEVPSEELHPDISVAMIQGATSATSDGIIDTSSPSSGDTVSEESGGISLAQEDSHERVPVDTSSLANGDALESADTSIIGLLASDDASLSTPTNLLDISPESDSSGTDPALSLSEEASSDGVDQSTSSRVNLDSLALSEIHTPGDSPLHDMLREFIQKLEHFHAESATLDTEMTETVALLSQEEDELKREYDVRKTAIDYKRKHIEETRASRIAEKSRLEHIIEKLKEELV